jgi:hypothetical protein
VASSKKDSGKSHTNIIIRGDDDDRKHRRFGRDDGFFGGRDSDWDSANGAQIASAKKGGDRTNIVIRSDRDDDRDHDDDDGHSFGGDDSEGLSVSSGSAVPCIFFFFSVQVVWSLTFCRPLFIDFA